MVMPTEVLVAAAAPVPQVAAVAALVVLVELVNTFHC